MAYSFKEQLALGEEQERLLDDFFKRRGWKIFPADMLEQKTGIDRWFANSMVPDRLAIEYKTDFVAHRTNNLYMETVAHGTYQSDGTFKIGKPGWVLTTLSDYLFYHIPGDEKILIFRPKRLRKWFKKNMSMYKEVRVRNQGFYGAGLLVPIKDIEDVLEKTLTTEE